MKRLPQRIQGWFLLAVCIAVVAGWLTLTPQTFYVLTLCGIALLLFGDD